MKSLALDLCMVLQKTIKNHRPYPFFWGPKKQQKLIQECIPVGCLPPVCWPYPSIHCARGGGLSLVLGHVCPGGCLPRGVYPSMQWGRRPSLWTDRHLWKHNLCKLFCRAVISFTAFHGITRYGDKLESLCKLKHHKCIEMHENKYIVIQLHGIFKMIQMMLLHSIVSFEFNSHWRQLYFLLKLLRHLNANFVQKCQKCQICVIYENLDCWCGITLSSNQMYQ